MKNLISEVIAWVFVLLLLSRFHAMPKSDLEIYTCENIYYISGLHVGDELGHVDTLFASQKLLKLWFAERTANDGSLNCINN